MKYRPICVFFILVTLVGCQTVSKYEHRLEDIDNDNDDRISVHVIGISQYDDNGPFNGVGIQINNHTDSSVIIDWDLSALIFNNESHQLMLSNMRFFKSADPIRKQIIAPDTFIRRGVYPADRLDGANILPIRAEKVTVLILLIVNGEPRYYGVTAKIDETRTELKKKMTPLGWVLTITVGSAALVIPGFLLYLAGG